MTNKKVPKSSNKYNCECCDYHTSRISQYNRHLLTAKHRILTNTNENSSKGSKVHICDCGKEYKHASSLIKHRKKCTYTTEEEPKNTIMPPEE